MSTRPVIVDAVAGQDAAQGAFAQDEGVVHPPAPDRADEPLREGVLPWAVRRRHDFPPPVTTAKRQRPKEFQLRVSIF